jgi:DNA invertase Pin-like site-specific DNA recombinase
MNLGYARVSTNGQEKNGHSLDAQRKALKEAGCERIFEDTASGGNAERPNLDRLFEQLREGDVLVVYKLDRLTRSLRHLLNLLDRLKNIGARFRSLSENLDTTTPSGNAMMQMIGVFAEFERALLRERTRDGLAEARAKGHHPGRPPKLSKEKRCEIVRLVQTGQKTAAECSRLFEISEPSVSRLLGRAAIQQAVAKKG